MAQDYENIIELRNPASAPLQLQERKVLKQWLKIMNKI